MPKQILTGSLDEQSAFLYDLAVRKMGEGNYTGAVHALDEIVKHNPGYRDAVELLLEARKRKSVHSWLLWFAIVGAVIGIAAGTLSGMPNDLYLLGLGLVGALVGYLVGNYTLGLRGRE